MKAYERQEIVAGRYSPSLIARLKKMYEKWKENQEKQDQILSRQNQFHREFMEKMNPQNYEKNNETNNLHDNQQTKLINKQDNREER